MNELTKFFEPEKEIDNISEIKYIPKKRLFFWKGDKNNYFFSLESKKVILKTNSSDYGHNVEIDFTNSYLLSKNKYAAYQYII